jgi:hypothetical protein
MGLFLVSCNEPEFVGSDLIEDDAIVVTTQDTFTFHMRTVGGDDITVYNRGSIEPGQMMVGNMEDGVFGRNEASLYLQFRSVFQVPNIEDTDELVVDSVVLQLEYDSLRFYGDFERMHSFEVYRVNEPIPNEGPYTQDVSFNFDPDPIGLRDNFIARPDKLVRLAIPSNKPVLDTISTVPHLRIRLDNEIGEELLSLDSLELANDSILQERIFPGVYIREKESVTSQSFLGFRPRVQNPFVESNRVSGIIMYYREVKPDTTIYGAYRLTVTGSAALQNMQFDYTGTLLEQALNSSGPDSLNFIQGFTGPEIEIEFPYIRNLGNILINIANLEIYLATPLDYSYDEYDPVFFVRTAEITESGELENTREYELAFNQNAPNFFGGSAQEVLDEDGEVIGLKYTFNLAEHFQKMVDGKVTNKLSLLVNPKLTNPQRSVMYGKDGAKMPARLRITYSKN